MPGELGNEDEQQSVGYYEHRIAPDDDANTPPRGTISEMEKKVPRTSVMKVLRDYTKSKMQEDYGKMEY